MPSKTFGFSAKTEALGQVGFIASEGCWKLITYLPSLVLQKNVQHQGLWTLGTCSFQVKCSEPESENIKLLVEINKIKPTLPVRLKLMFLGSNPLTESYKRLELRFGLTTFLQESGGKAVGLQIFGQRSCQAWNFLMGKKYAKCFKGGIKKEWDPSNIFQATFFRAQKLVGYILFQPIKCPVWCLCKSI